MSIGLDAHGIGVAGRIGDKGNLLQRWRLGDVHDARTAPNRNQRVFPPVGGSIAPAIAVPDRRIQILIPQILHSIPRLRSGGYREQRKGTENFLGLNTEYRHPSFALTGAADYGKAKGSLFEGSFVFGYQVCSLSSTILIIILFFSFFFRFFYL